FTVTVANVARTPALSTLCPYTTLFRSTISFSNQFDPSSADTSAGFHYAFACDNGSLAGATYAGSGTSASAQCTFPDNGTYPVRARIIDKDGGSTEYTTSVSVLNVAPSLSGQSDQSPDEGASHSFDLGSFSDPGAFDNPWDVTVSWGDGSPDTTLAFSARGAMGTTPHTYD